MKALTPEEKHVILDKGTEAPFSGIYVDSKAEGVYTCKQCGSVLFSSSDKFESDCGWPAFEDEVNSATTKSLDSDGVRTEISCARCGGHLGHVFTGEHLTNKNTRYCVNSISIDFTPKDQL
ncbi:methionine-R-sulfoxide reductase [Candidatus Saccharibacteria bacterium]|nr:methionine-R-sulfoxide reductase [Candidatus Saccharibacteria bacterium]